MFEQVLWATACSWYLPLSAGTAHTSQTQHISTHCRGAETLPDANLRPCAPRRWRARALSSGTVRAEVGSPAQASVCGRGRWAQFGGCQSRVLGEPRGEPLLACQGQGSVYSSALHGHPCSVPCPPLGLTFWGPWASHASLALRTSHVDYQTGCGSKKDKARSF